VTVSNPNEAPPQTDKVYFSRVWASGIIQRDGSGRQWKTASSFRQ
jgi:hypothetical protein